MGLKESGLRGSLRSTSSVLPAFFDVTITNTNSPVQEGDILTVDYSADNTGDAQDTQDIRLEIDSVEEDRDSDITLLGAQSTTGTLEWDTTDEDETTYTATVLSDDDTDSVTVEIESDAIPDSAIAHFDATQEDFDDGDAVTTITDFSGEGNDLTGGSPQFVENVRNGNPVFRFDGEDDELGRSGPVIEQPFTWFVVSQIDDTNPSDGDDDAIFSSEDDGDNRANFRARFSDQNDFNGFWGDSIRDGTPDENWNIYTGIIDGGDSEIRRNGSTLLSGDLGNHDHGGFLMGNTYVSGHYLNGDVAEWVVTDDLLDSSAIAEEEERLASKWDISLD